MDKFLDFLKELKARASNPLISSFIISWSVVNWRVIIGLIFYTNEQLKFDGYKSKIDLVYQNDTSTKYFLIPIAFALAYTFLFPFVKNYIQAFNSWIRSWGSDLDLKYAKKGKISVEKYIKLRDLYTGRISELEKAIADESSLFVENQELKSKISVLSNDKHVLNDQLQFIKEKTTINSYNGEWKMKYQNMDGELKNERVWISNSDISILNEKSVYVPLFRITSITYNPILIEYVWIVEETKSNRTFIIFFRPTNSNDQHFLKSTNNNSKILELEVA